MQLKEGERLIQSNLDLLLIKFVAQQMSSRIFHQLQNRVGDHGTYQYLLIAYCCIISIPSYSCFFSNMFLFYQPPYECASYDATRCHDYVCSLPSSERVDYTDGSFSSLSSRMGDFRCQGKGDLVISQTAVFIGSMAGSISGMVVSGLSTHRKIILYTAGICIVGVAITLLSQSLLVATIGLIINIFAASIQAQIYVSYVVETTSEQLRQKAVFLTYFSFTFGVVLTSLLFWVIPVCQIVISICLLLPNILILAGGMTFIEETPLDLVTNYPPGEVVSSLQRVATINQVPFSITVGEIVQLQQQFAEHVTNRQQNQSVSVLDMLTYKSLRTLSIVTFLLRFLLAYPFYSPQFQLQNFASNIYLNGIVMALAETLSSFLIFCLLNCLPRIPIIIGSSICSMVVALALLLFLPCAYGQECSEMQKNMQTVGLFIFKFINTVAYGFIYIYKTEAFPSQIRLIAMQATATASKMGMCLTPGLSALLQQLKVSVLLGYVIICGCMAILAIPLPETFAIAPPQLIQQLDFKMPNQGDEVREYSD